MFNSEHASGKSRRIHLSLDSDAFTFDRSGSVGVDEIFVERDGHGNMVAKIEETVQVPWQLTQGGAKYQRTFPLRTDATTLRVIVREPAERANRIAD